MTHRRRARARRVAAHRRVRPDRRSIRTTRCSRAASSWRGRVGSRRPRSAPTPTPASSRPRRAGSRSRRSELVDGINTILRYVTWLILVVGPLLLLAPAPGRATSPTRSPARSPASSAWCPRASCSSRASRSASPRSTLARRKVLVQELPGGRGPRPRRRRLPRQDRNAHRGLDRVRRASSRSAARRRRASARRSVRSRRDDNANATLDALAAAFSDDPGWTRTGAVPVLVGPQVERGCVRGPRQLGDRRAGDGVGRPRRARSARRADELAATGQPHAAPRPHRRRRSTARRCPPASTPVALVLLRGAGASRRGRDPRLLPASRASR